VKTENSVNNLTGNRHGNGRFAIGNPGGPGRPRRAVELQYLGVLADAVTLRKWKKIILRAVEDAIRGDSKARRWLGKHVLGHQPITLSELAAVELAGTLDQDIQARADGLRVSAYRKGILNRALVPTAPQAPTIATENDAMEQGERQPSG
jgi:hypothetical protein